MRNMGPAQRVPIEDSDEKKPEHATRIYSASPYKPPLPPSSPSPLPPPSPSLSPDQLEILLAKVKTCQQVQPAIAGEEDHSNHNITTSPHKAAAQELLRRNAETKKVLRANTSRLMDQLSATRQLFQSHAATPQK